MKRKKMTNLTTNDPDTLVFHREMYKRRLDRLKNRGGFTEREISEQVNNPALFRRVPETLGASSKKEGAEQPKDE